MLFIGPNGILEQYIESRTRPGWLDNLPESRELIKPMFTILRHQNIGDYFHKLLSIRHSILIR